MLLYLYVNLRLMNKLTSEMGNIFTDTMRDSHSHEFEEMFKRINIVIFANRVRCLETG